jgi:hypothetical protein
MAKQELETRIAAALTSDSITSANFYALIEETTAAITEGETTAAQEKERAFDPALSPDPKLARERMEDALFKVGRLKTLLPRLQKLACEVRAREEIVAFAVKRDALQAEGDALEQELDETYCEYAERIVDVFRRASAFRDRVRQELPPVPPGVAAFRQFDDSVARLLKNVALVGLDGKQQVWPPPELSWNATAAAFAQSMIVPHPGSAWADPDVQQRRRAAVMAEQEQIGAYHEQATKQQEERLNREERERAQAFRHARPAT